MKKFLSIMLSVCLLISLAMPSLMAASANDTSLAGGFSDEITSLKADKASYTIMQDQELNLKKHITAFCGSNKICESNYVDYSFSITDRTGAFMLDESTGVITAGDSTGSATVTVKANTDKVKTIITVNAKPRVRATSFSFEKTSYSIPVGGNSSNSAKLGDYTIKLIAQPEGAVFTSEQKNAIEDEFRYQDDEFIKTWGLTDIAGDFSSAAIPTGEWDEENPSSVYNIKYEANYLSNIQRIVPQGDDGRSNRKVVKIDFPRSAGGGYSIISKPLNIATVVGVSPRVISAESETMTITIGETKSIVDKFRFGPSDANIKTDVTYSTDYANDTASYDDYAKVDDKGNITGIAIGTNKVVCTLNENGKSASITVKVVKAGEALNTAKIELSATEIKVGAETTAKLVGVETDAKITWKMGDETIAGVSPIEGVSTKVIGKKAGTVKITAVVEEKEIASATIVVKDANESNGSTPPVPDFTENPQTGDSLFANLF